MCHGGVDVCSIEGKGIASGVVCGDSAGVFLCEGCAGSEGAEVDCCSVAGEGDVGGDGGGEGLGVGKWRIGAIIP